VRAVFNICDFLFIFRGKGKVGVVTPCPDKKLTMQKRTLGVAIMSAGALIGLAYAYDRRTLPGRILESAVAASDPHLPLDSKIARWKKAQQLANSSSETAGPVRFTLGYGLAQTLAEHPSTSRLAEAEFTKALGELDNVENVHSLSDVQRLRLAITLDSLAQIRQDKKDFNNALCFYDRALDCIATPEEVRLASPSLIERGASKTTAGILNNYATLLMEMGESKGADLMLDYSKKINQMEN